MKNCRYLFYASVVLLFVGVLGGIMLGKPQKLTRGYDSDDYACGVDPGLEDYPFVYFVNPTPEYKHRLVCVKECPKGDTKLLECATNSEIQDCKQQYSITQPEKVLYYYESFSYKGNVCMPTSLEYYHGVQDFATPNQFKTVIHDIYHSRYLIFLVSFPTVLLICYFLMDLLKKNTTYLVWTFALSSLLMVGFMGAYFIQQWNFARHYSDNEATINNFKVSDDYIYKMTNRPQELSSAILGITFIVCFIYGVQWLFKNADRVQDLADIFEYVEKFMRKFKYLQHFSYFFIGMFIIIFILMFTGALLLGSNFTLDQDDSLGPFEKTYQNVVLQSISIIVIIIGIWMISVINGAYQYSIFAAFNNWLHLQQNDQNYDINTSTILLRSAITNLNLDIICTISTYLQLSPIKFVLDYIKDTLQQIVKFNNPFKGLAVYEEVLYYEINDNTVRIDEAKNKIKQTLKIEADGNEVEAFEIVRNINDFFLLIVKLFIFLLSGALFLGIYSTITGISNTVPITQAYFQLNIYQPLFPALICGIIGYYIAQIYFAQYTVVQCFGYKYLELFQKYNSAYESFRLANELQFKSQADMIVAFQNTNLAKVFIEFKENFPELQEMMIRILKPGPQHQDQQQV